MKRFLFISMIFMACASSLVFAQDDTGALNLEEVSEPIFLGITMGYNRSMHSAELPSIVVEEGAAACPVFPEGTDNGFWFGITYEQFFGDFANSKHSLIIRALMSTYPSSTQVGGEEYPSRIPVYENGQLVEDRYINSSTEHNMRIKYTVVQSSCTKEIFKTYLNYVLA